MADLPLPEANEFSAKIRALRLTPRATPNFRRKFAPVGESLHG